VLKLTAPFFLLAGCTGSAAGEVKDAKTGQPVAGAVLQTSNPVWGFRGGQPVWDNEKISTAISGPDGRFRFDVSGGTGLNVTARSYRPVRTSFCPGETLVLMGGPEPGLVTDQRLMIADDLAPEESNSSHAALARDLGIKVSGSAFSGGSVLRIDGPGVRFVSGTGAIPAPPPLPYPASAEADVGRQCGWFFISDGRRPIAVIQAARPSAVQAPGRPWRSFLMYAPIGLD
jgi:hypothetical protein